MKDLSRHIEYLLASHDEVAVPGLCTFVSENRSARYIVGESTFLPPYRSVYVRNTINPDDSKLADCIMKIHHVSRNIASQWIYDYTADIRSTIIEQGAVEIGTIGELSQKGADYLFNVCEAGINSPELYGLDSFLLTRLHTAEKNDNDADIPRITISIRRSTVQRTLAAAAVVLIAFMLFVPQFSNFDVRATAKVLSWNAIESVFFSKVKPQRASALDDMVDEIPKASVSTTVPVNRAPSGNAVEENHTDVVPTGYCVVMASAITDDMADAYVQKLQGMGLENAMKIKDGKMIRVILAGYADSAKAYDKVREIRNSDPLFAQIWVMAL